MLGMLNIYTKVVQVDQVKFKSIGKNIFPENYLCWKLKLKFETCHLLAVESLLRLKKNIFLVKLETGVDHTK